MIFNLQSTKNKLLEKSYNQSMKEIGDFFEFKWKENKPKFFIVKDRNSVDELQERKTENWVCGWVRNLNLYILERNSFSKEISNKGYSKLVKHELTHCFFQIFSEIIDKPIKPKWLSEGVAIYLADQINPDRMPTKFKSFLFFYEGNQKKNGYNIYSESGFVVKLLIEAYGKKRLLKLIKSLKENDTQKKFNKKFEEIYGFKLNYGTFNKKFSCLKK